MVYTQLLKSGSDLRTTRIELGISVIAAWRQAYACGWNLITTLMLCCACSSKVSLVKRAPAQGLVTWGGLQTPKWSVVPEGCL